MKHRRTAVATTLASLAALAALATLATWVAGGVTGVARADPLANAKQQAAALQVQVTQLQLRVEVASEKFDGAQADLAQLINAQEQATRAATAATVAAQNARDAAESSTRALYMSGGITGLYATVLTGENPGTLLDGLHSVQVVSDAAAASLSHVDSTVQAAADADAKVAALRTRQDALTLQAANASADAQSALAQEQEILDNTNAEVVALEAQLQIQIDEQNAARDAATLAAAQQAAVVAGGPAGTPSALAVTAINAARTQLGKPYVYGGSGPDSWDCSGLTQWAFAQAGVLLPRTAADQYAAVPTKIALGDLEPGDLLFWATDTSDWTTIHHVAIYLGAGEMLAAPHTGDLVQIQPVYLDGYIGAVRVG
jgi:cell wall-associated NlpC family hydrolase